jgi:putative N6-adenine-specific DNA methylase
LNSNKISFTRINQRPEDAGSPLQLTITTPGGLETVLKEEVENLGIEVLQVGKRQISVKGDTASMYKCLFECRMAIRVLIPLYSFQINSPEDLYEGVRDFEWEDWFSVKETFAIDGVIFSDIFNNSLFAIQRCKDGIADRFRLRRGLRPDVDVKRPQFRVNLHISGQVVTLSMDAAGESLHKRGYRIAHGPAPISEVLAAGMLSLAGWQGDREFVDLFCGSGTLLIEAAMKAAQIPAGKWAKEPGIHLWKGHQPELWNQIKSDALSKVKPIFFPIRGWDNDLNSIHTAREIIEFCGLENQISLERKDMRKALPEKESGMLMSNLPYGERIDFRNDPYLFKDLGKKMKFDFGGWQAWLLFGERQAEAEIGLKPFKRIPLMNGKIPVMFAGYSLFRGSRKDYLSGAEPEKNN